MSQVKKPSPSQVKLFNALKEANGSLTIAELAVKLGKKPSSVGVELSQLRGILAKSGKKLGALEPKKMRNGGGRGFSVSDEAFASMLDGLDTVDNSEVNEASEETSTESAS